MATTQLEMLRDTICNAESVIACNCITGILANWLQEEKMRIVSARDRSGAHASHPEKYHRERWELFQTRILAVENLRETLPVVALDLLAGLDSKNLMGGKPTSSLPAVRALLNDHRQSAILRNRQENLALSATFRRDEWNRNDAIATACDSMLIELAEQFPGNAEEQPGPREESRPLTGKIPVTAGGAFAAAMTSAALRDHIEDCLRALEERGEGDRWAVVESAI